MSLPSRYSNAQHPELLPKLAGYKAVERHARAIGQLEKLSPTPSFLLERILRGGMRWGHFVVIKFKEDMYDHY
jgi:hypothetical protein